MPPRIKSLSLVWRPIQAGQSVDPKDVRRRVLSVYKAWYRQLPTIVYDYNLLVTPEQARTRLREEFMRNANLMDPRVIDLLCMKSMMELNETVNLQKEACHLMKYFDKTTEYKKPEDFLGRFLSKAD